MKNTTIFFAIIPLLTSSLLFSQDLFTEYNPSLDTYNQIVNNTNNVNIEEIKKNIIFYELDSNVFDYIMDNDVDFFHSQIPFFNNDSIYVEMEIYDTNNIQLRRHTDRGIINEYYSPKIKIYKIKNIEQDIEGLFIFSKKGLKSVFIKNDITYQIDVFTQTENENSIYFVLDINNSIIDFDFSCSHDLLDEIPTELNFSNYRSAESFGCLDIAIEIDHYTFQTFNNYEDAIDWALEMMAIAEMIYLEELDLSIVSSSAQIWEIEDPYSDFINDPQSMLIAMRDNWMNNEEFSDIERHLVHLFSKRNNTGTGGIAFLNGVGSAWNGYGFSSNLVDVEEYVDLPVPYFFWNVYCLVHELGHNLGAKHTQWCGWPGGPIDNCASIEEVNPGECDSYIDNPTPEIGSIMSYCHTWSFQSGGGIILKFHDYVKESIIPYLGLQDLYDCLNVEQLFGCMDINACNYNDLANIDDLSCLYPELNFDCDGNCLNDVNQNNICDEDELLFSNKEIIDPRLSIFPNPASNFITVRLDNLDSHPSYINLYNSVGQLVIETAHITNNTKIDISDVSSGYYSLHMIADDKTTKQIVIIQ